MSKDFLDCLGILGGFALIGFCGFRLKERNPQMYSYIMNTINKSTSEKYPELTYNEEM